MRKTMAVMMVLAVLLFGTMYLIWQDLSAIALGLVLGSIFDAGRYILSRYGHGEINDIAIFKRDPSLYIQTLNHYGWLLVAGAVIALLYTVGAMWTVGAIKEAAAP
jgi:hypothetical protein